MRLALITLSAAGAAINSALAEALPGADCYVHRKAGAPGIQFDSVVALTAELFEQVDGIVYVAPCGVAVRALAPLVRHKTSDPAVVVLDVGARYAVSLLSGHEGGANDLAIRVANVVGAEPVISTTTEALKTVIVGIGCRRGTPADRIIQAVTDGVREAGAGMEEVRLLASASVKADEEGLLEASRELGIPVRFISGHEIRASDRAFGHSEFVEKKVGLPAVAEPAALLAGRRTRLCLPRKVFDGITVAVARESSWSSESDRGDSSTGPDGPNGPSRKARSSSATRATSD